MNFKSTQATYIAYAEEGIHKTLSLFFFAFHLNREVMRERKNKDRIFLGHSTDLGHL